jgi:hypothetical protein
MSRWLSENCLYLTQGWTCFVFLCLKTFACRYVVCEVGHMKEELLFTAASGTLRVIIM